MCCSERATPATIGFCGGHRGLVSCCYGGGRTHILIKKSEISICLVHITHKGPVSDCGTVTYHPCVALGELHRQQSAPVAVVASSSRVQRRWKCSHSRKKKRNIGIFGPHHSQGASFRLRDRYISPMHCSQRARPRKLGAHGGCCSLVSCARGEGNARIFAKKKRNIDLFGPYHSEEAGFRLRYRYTPPVCYSERARPGRTSFHGDYGGLVSVLLWGWQHMHSHKYRPTCSWPLPLTRGRFPAAGSAHSTPVLL
jgi:hypothetical protein